MKAVPIFKYAERQAEEALEVHSKLVWLQRKHPELAANRLFQKMMQDASDLFKLSFEKVR